MGISVHMTPLDTVFMLNLRAAVQFWCRYSRNFAQEPVAVLASTFEPEEEMAGCDVPCVFTRQNSSRSVQTPEGLVPAYDAHQGNQQGEHDGLPYFRHMESVSNFPDRAIDNMHASGVQIVMSPQLSSDVPAGYLSWAGKMPATPTHACPESNAAVSCVIYHAALNCQHLLLHACLSFRSA